MDPRLPDLPSHMQAQTPSTPSGATDLEQSTTSPPLNASRGARSHTLRASLTFPQMRPSLRARFSESLPALLDGEQDGLGDASLDVSGALTTASILRGQQAVTNTVEDLVTAVLLCLVCSSPSIQPKAAVPSAAAAAAVASSLRVATL